MVSNYCSRRDCPPFLLGSSWVTRLGVKSSRGLPRIQPHTCAPRVGLKNFWRRLALGFRNLKNAPHNSITMEDRMDHAQMQECLHNCQECHAVCTETIQHCLKLGGKHGDAEHIRLLLDCAQICQMSADYMLRGSSFHFKACGLCAEVCQSCADSCERIGKDDAMMKKCAETCRRCAESCRTMSSVKAAA